MLRRAPALALALALAMPAATARAAPPDPDGEEELACEEPSLEGAKLTTGRDLYVRAEQRYDEGDYLGAIELWELTLVLMPEKTSLGVQLAHAYRRAYLIDSNDDHLHAARALFEERLAKLDADEEHTREDIEAEIAEIDLELDAIAAAEARAQAEREEEIRQEQMRLNELALAEAKAKHERGVQKIYLGVGGSVAGLGLASLVAMSTFLGLGPRVDRQGRTLASDPGRTQDEYADLITRGESYNRAAVTAGVLGGVLVLSGASALIVAAVRHKRLALPARGSKAALSPGFGGLQLRF